MTNSSTLIIGSGDLSLFKGTDIQSTYRHETKKKPERILRKICLMLPLLPKKVWFDDWINKEYSTIILFDTGNGGYIVNYLRKRYPAARIIFWYWNPVKNSISLDRIDRTKCEVWSYNEQDCKDYGLKHNTQFYVPHNWCDEPSGEIKQDVYFVGQDKRRADILYKFNQECVQYGISFKYVLTKGHDDPDPRLEYSKGISYQDNLKNVSESRCVLDIIGKGCEDGFSIRPFEAAENHKKLITNDKKVKQLKFYSKDNIFVLGEDSMDMINDFMKSEYDDSVNSLLQYYSFNSWKSRFKES